MFFQVDFRLSIIASSSPLGFVTEYTGDVLIYREDDSTSRAGKARVFVIHAEAASLANVLLAEVLDLRSATAPYIGLLSKSEAGNFTPAVMRILGEECTMSQNMLILDRLEILPKYRGDELGLGVMRACLDRFSGGCRIAAIKPYPLQFEVRSGEPQWAKRMGFAAMRLSQRGATARLKKYYSQLGFVSVRGTDLMILDLYKPD